MGKYWGLTCALSVLQRACEGRVAADLLSHSSVAPSTGSPRWNTACSSQAVGQGRRRELAASKWPQVWIIDPIPACLEAGFRTIKGILWVVKNVEKHAVLKPAKLHPNMSFLISVTWSKWRPIVIWPLSDPSLATLGRGTTQGMEIVLILGVAC